MGASDAMFDAFQQKYSARLRRARLARQVRITGWTGIEDTVTKVMLQCLVRDVDRVAVAKLFDELQIVWLAKLPGGSIREVDGWDIESRSWVVKHVDTPQDHIRYLRAQQDSARAIVDSPRRDAR